MLKSDQKYPPVDPASLTWRKTLLVPTQGTASPVERHTANVQQTIIWNCLALAHTSWHTSSLSEGFGLAYGWMPALQWGKRNRPSQSRGAAQLIMVIRTSWCGLETWKIFHISTHFNVFQERYGLPVFIYILQHTNTVCSGLEGNTHNSPARAI